MITIFITKITVQAALRCCEEIVNSTFGFECDIDSLPNDVRVCIADRLYEDDGCEYVCEAVIGADGKVEPRFERDGPCLLVVDGTGIEDLIEAVRQDQAEVVECLASMAAKKGHAA